MSTWRYLWRLVRYAPGVYLAFVVLESLHVMVEMAPGLLAREFFNILSGPTPATRGVWWLIVLVCVSSIAHACCWMSASLFAVTFRFTTGALLRKNVLERVFELPGARSLPESPGEATSRFGGDVDEIMEYISWLGATFGLVVFAVVALTIMLRINARITVVVFVPLLCVIAIANAASRRFARYRRASRRAAGRVIGFLGETFGGAQAITRASAEKHVIGHFHGLNEVRRIATVKDRLFHQVFHSIFWNTVNLGTGAILILAGGAMRDGSFTLGDFALFVFYLEYMTEITAYVGEMLARYQQSGVSFQRLLRLMQGAPAEQLVRPAPVYMRGPYPEVPYRPKMPADRLELLEVHGLTCRHPESGRGVEDVDLSLRRGAFVVVTGRVGAGKTTLLRAFLGLLPRDGGTILWNGQQVEDPASFLLPPRCAYTAQVPRLFSETLEENILLGLPRDKADIEGALTKALMERDLAEMPDGLATLIGPKGVRLSGGSYSARLRRACSFGMRNCWSLTTSPALWTWRPNVPCGSACSPSGKGLRAHRRAWWSRIGASRCAGRTTSLC